MCIEKRWAAAAAELRQRCDSDATESSSGACCMATVRGSPGSINSCEACKFRGDSCDAVCPCPVRWDDRFQTASLSSLRNPLYIESTAALRVVRTFTVGIVLLATVTEARGVVVAGLPRIDPVDVRRGPLGEYRGRPPSPRRCGYSASRTPAEFASNPDERSFAQSDLAAPISPGDFQNDSVRLDRYSRC